MAAAAPTIPPTQPVAYGEVAQAGSGYGVLVPPEILLPHSAEAAGAVEQKMVPVSVTFGPVVSARPQSVRFGALADPKLRLRQAIPLEVSTEDSGVVLTWAEIDEFGCGETLGAAMDNFGAALLELYRRLHDPVQLGPDLENVKSILDSYIQARPR
jgi:hypothetical protein